MALARYAKELRFLADVKDEYLRSRVKFDAFHNGHEGYAVLLEEVEEVWSEIKHPTSYDALRAELVQVAAMAMAMAVELQP